MLPVAISLPPFQVPVNGVTQRDLHALSRWMAGLLCLSALPLAELARVRARGRPGPARSPQLLPLPIWGTPAP
jgi:hypothetical protein